MEAGSTTIQLGSGIKHGNVSNSTHRTTHRKRHPHHTPQATRRRPAGAGHPCPRSPIPQVTHTAAGQPCRTGQPCRRAAMPQVTHTAGQPCRRRRRAQASRCGPAAIRPAAAGLCASPAAAWLACARRLMAAGLRQGGMKLNKLMPVACPVLF